MYAYISGTLEEVEEQNIVVDANGIGYNIMISTGDIEKLPPLGERVKVYTYTSVREDAFLLFGFLEKQGLSMFRDLIRVEKIGPKNALSILAAMSVSEIIMAIVEGNAKAFTKASGIGLKSGEKIIVELKSRVRAEDALADMGITQGMPAAADSGGENVREAVLALVTLGYTNAEAKKAVLEASKTMPDAASDELLKGALKYL